MTKREVLLTGLKLLGVYYAVEGLSVLPYVVPMFLIHLMSVFSLFKGEGVPPTWLIEILPPAAHLAAAYLLILRTEMCEGWVMRGEA